VTFNYDCILEATLRHVGTPYRRFPYRYQLHETFGLVSDSAELDEILILKVHGSLDWVSGAALKSQIERYREADPETADYISRTDPVFGADAITPTSSLIQGPYPLPSELADVYVLEDLDSYYDTPTALYTHAPLILAPSSAKQLYGRALSRFWTGLDAYGASGFSVIGYSLPSADPYAKQALFRCVQGYLRTIDHRVDGADNPRLMDLVSLKRSKKEIDDLIARYRFMTPEHTNVVVTGFDDTAVDALFRAQ
jgi:hypothetical protein